MDVVRYQGIHDARNLDTQLSFGVTLIVPKCNLSSILRMLMVVCSSNFCDECCQDTASSRVVEEVKDVYYKTK